VSGNLKRLLAVWGLSAGLCFATGSTGASPQEESPSAASVSIDWNALDQRIDGFGAAHYAGPELRPDQIELVFSPTSGIGLDYLREVVPTDGSIDGLGLMQAAVAYGVKVWAAPWSPPASMKTNGSTRNGGSLLVSKYEEYANYLENYVNALATKGISLYALSVQNEPENTESYDSCVWTDLELRDFIKNDLGPRLADSGVMLMMPETANWDSLSAYAGATMNDSTAAGYVGILAAHDYDSAYSPQMTYGKPLWETEVSDFDPEDQTIESGLRYAMAIHNLMTVAKINAWHFWQITRNRDDNECLICNGRVTKRLYTIGNFSKFIRPGYYRIDATVNPAPGVYASAYKDPVTDNFAIVVLNTNRKDTPVSFHFNGFSSTTVTPWVTSESLNLAQQAAIPCGSEFSSILAGQSVTTFVGAAGRSEAEPFLFGRFRGDAWRDRTVQFFSTKKFPNTSASISLFE